MAYGPFKTFTFLVCLFIYAPVLSEVVTSSPTVSNRAGSFNPNQQPPDQGTSPSNEPVSDAIEATSTTSTDDSLETVDVGSGGEGAYQQATAAQGKANMTSMLGMGIAMAAFPSCGPTNPYACALGAAGIAVAMLGNNKANEAQNLRNQLYGGENGGQDPIAIDTAAIRTQIDEGLVTTTDAGFNVGDDGTITFPNGKEVDVNNLSSSSLQAAGLSPAQAEQFIDDFNNQSAAGASKFAKNKGGEATDSEDDDSLTVASVDGGGSGSLLAGRGKRRRGYEDDEGLSEEGLQVASLERDPASFDELSVKYGKDKIGVQGSDLFRRVEEFVRKDKVINGLPN